MNSTLSILKPSDRGSVLGIDVGFANNAKKTYFCLLTWDRSRISLNFQCAGTDIEERKSALKEVGTPNHIEGVAIDGPLTHGLRLVPHYRSAEALLSRGALQKRCKPGQTSSPIGQQLHRHATYLANLALTSTHISDATHFQPIHAKRIVEAFPNAFLAAIIPEKDLPQLRRDASDRYWETTVLKASLLEQLVNLLLPGRRLQFDLSACTNHEHRAGVVCALTALTVVVGLHVGVGDPVDGDIILPPRNSWGIANTSSSSWMEMEILSNVPKVRASPTSNLNHHHARINLNLCQWIP
jgi:predicted nuclease with RNAse H fold